MPFSTIACCRLRPSGVAGVGRNVVMPGKKRGSSTCSWCCSWHQVQLGLLHGTLRSAWMAWRVRGWVSPTQGGSTELPPATRSQAST